MGWLPSVKWDLKWKKWVQLFKVEKMRLIKEKIEELNIINKNWIDIARDEINNEKEPSNQQLVKLFNELWNLIRESLKEDYLNEIDDYFDYKLIEKRDMIILKHSQKLIKSKENLLFPCRIFLKAPIEKIKYTISSKFNDKIIEREISIK